MKVLVAFDDTSLGGTSRSAVLFAQIWQRAGAEVGVYSPRAIHSDRLKTLEALGVASFTDLNAAIADPPSLIHLHHAAASKATLSWVNSLLESAAPAPTVLFHNIFGQNLGIQREGTDVVAVLGHWLAAQYTMQAKGKALLRIIPNPQNFDFFRPPTAAEKQSAREALGIAPHETVLLRVGSPNIAKWNRRAYVKLAAKIETSQNLKLRLIGAPPELRHLNQLARTHAQVDLKSSDAALREEYWAADTFVHWANRGESFGNVILEALGTGLRVVYRARPTRDNTPAEFRAIEDFDYEATTRGWLSASRRPRALTGLRAGSRDPLLDVYSASHVEKLLGKIVEAHEVGGSVYVALVETLARPKRLARRSRILVFFRHNPLAAKLKNMRFRLRG